MKEDNGESLLDGVKWLERRGFQEDKASTEI